MVKKVFVKNQSTLPHWLHAYANPDGTTYRWFDCPKSTKEKTYEFDDKMVYFAYMVGQSGGTNFEPQEIYPLHGDITITFYDDRAVVSPWYIQLANNSASEAEYIAKFASGNTESKKVAANGKTEWVINNGDEITEMSVKTKTVQSFGKPKNGQTYAVDKDAHVTVANLTMQLPVCDVAVKIANQSGQLIYIRIYYRGNRWVWFSIRADQPPFIWFMPEHPDTIQYSTKDPNGPDGWQAEKVLKWKPGTSITIRPPGLENLSDEVFEMLKSSQMMQHGAAFNSHFIDTEVLPELTERDLKEMGLPIAHRKKMMKQIAKFSTEKKKKAHEGTWDVFISHKQLNGADLAQAIKLQLELIHPEVSVFLDVDDLHHIHSLEDNILKSRNVILLITEGVLERPFVQKEIISAVTHKKNVILVHDERNCRFPLGEGLPDDVKSVLMIKAIPYYREKVFRETCIKQIWEKMVHD